jgi:hypothetical protein
MESLYRQLTFRKRGASEADDFSPDKILSVFKCTKALKETLNRNRPDQRKWRK